MIRKPRETTTIAPQPDSATNQELGNDTNSPCQSCAPARAASAAAIEGTLTQYARTSKRLGLGIAIGNTALLVCSEASLLARAGTAGLGIVGSIALGFGPDALKRRVIRRLDASGNNATMAS